MGSQRTAGIWSITAAALLLACTSGCPQPSSQPASSPPSPVQQILNQQLQQTIAGLAETEKALRALEDAPRVFSFTPEGQRLEAERIRLWNEARSRREAGEFTAAVDLAQQVRAIDRDMGGKRSHQVVETLQWIADTQIEADDLDAARQTLSEVLEIVSSRYSPSDWETTDARIALENAAQLQRLDETARGRLRNVRQIPATAAGLRAENRLAEAAVILQEARGIVSELLGKKQRLHTELTEQLGATQLALGNRPQAEALLRESLAEYETILGKSHPATGKCLLALADVVRDRPAPQEALPLYRRSLKIAQETLGAESWEYALAASHLGELLRQDPNQQRESQQHLEAAFKVFRRQMFEAYVPDAIGIPWDSADRWRAFRDEHTQRGNSDLAARIDEAIRTFDSLTKLLAESAQRHYGRKDYAAALAPLEQTASMQAVYFGEHAPQAIDARLISGRTGRLAAITEPQRQELHSAETRLKQAEQHYVAKDYEAALAAARAVLDTRRQILGPEDADTVLSLALLGEIYRAAGQPLEAEPLLTEALRLGEPIWGEQYPAQVATVASLGLLYFNLGDIERARPLLARLQRGSEDGAEGQPTAPGIGALLAQAENHLADGQQAEARTLIAQIRELTAASRPESEASYGELLHRLALLDFRLDEPTRAERELAESLDIAERNLAMAFSLQSQAQQLASAKVLKQRLGAYLSVASHTATPAGEVYRHVLALKGTVFLRQWDIRQARDNPALAPLLEQLAGIDSQLATLVSRVPALLLSGPWFEQVGRLAEAKQQLEHELALQTAKLAGRGEYQPVTAADIEASLPEQAALLDIIEYEVVSAGKPANSLTAPQTRYAAFVVRPNRPIERIDLGPSDDFEPLVQRWRLQYAYDPVELDASSTTRRWKYLRDLERQIRDSRPGARPKPAEPHDPAVALRQRIWAPMVPHLEGITTVLYSPDGLLSLVPLAALPGGRPGSYLIEEVAIATVPVPAALPRLIGSDVAPADVSTPSLLLVGDVEFGPPATEGGRPKYSPLPGTAVEVDLVGRRFAASFPGAPLTALRGAEATKERLRESLEGRTYLLFATHGFYEPLEVDVGLFGDPWVSMMRETATADPADPAAGILPSFPKWEPNPEYTRMMWRKRHEQMIDELPELGSGIALAGANHAPAWNPDDPPTSDPGVLYAAEVAGLDLRGVELVTISACQSGLGRISGGEGLMGLQRAFQLAGARTTVSSLWKVDDLATQTLVAELHANLWQRKLPKLAALREAQLAMLSRYDPRSGQLRPRGLEPVSPADLPGKSGPLPPFYWAAFSLSGDWR